MATYEFDEKRKEIYLYGGRRLLGEEGLIDEFNKVSHQIDMLIANETGVPIEVTPIDPLPKHIRASLPLLFLMGYWLGKKHGKTEGKG